VRSVTSDHPCDDHPRDLACASMERMLPADNHVHSEWSWDTSTGASMANTCRRALEIGLPSIAFTEHVDFTTWGEDDKLSPGLPGIAWREWVTPLDVSGYQASLERCRERYPGLRILSGIEAGEPHRFARSVAAVLRTGSFDRVLGSLHSIVDEGRLVYADRLFETVAADDLMRRYFAELLELVKGSDVFQVLAHCDFPRRYWPRAAGEYDEADYEEEYRSVFRALASSGRALEINTRSPLASTTLMGWWYQEGGDAVSFGSDAHNPLRVGARFDLAVDVVEAAGFRPAADPFDFWRR
jgi:histidinol-phosphatase (PHP family)